MIRFDCVTLFPEAFVAVADFGITRRAREDGLWSLALWNPRDFTTDNYRTVDDRPYGGGPGMVMLAEPLAKAIAAAKAAAQGEARVIHLSPQGPVLDHAKVMRFSAETRLVLLCGRYEGVDERVHDHLGSEFDSWKGGEHNTERDLDCVSTQQLFHDSVHSDERR